MSAAIRDRLKALERRRNQLNRQAKQLSSLRNALILRNALLSAWCDSMTAWLVCSAVQAERWGEDPMLKAEIQQLVQQELQLLEQLRIEQGQPLDASVLPHPQVDSISPAGDLMGYLREIISLGPHPDATSWTGADMAALLRETVLQASLHMHRRQAPGDAQQGAGGLKEHWDRYMHALLSLFVVGRHCIAEEVICFDLDKLQSGPEYATAAEQRTAELSPLLNLTGEQKDIISCATEAYKGLCQLLHKQRQELQVCMAAAAAAAESDCAVGSSGGSNTAALFEASACGPMGSSSSSSRTMGLLAALDNRHKHLETQQRLLSRFEILLAKEYMLVVTLVALMVGCMSYEQLSHMSVLAWPHPVRLTSLAMDIRDLREQELEELQRRQRYQAAQRQRESGQSDDPSPASSS